MSLPIDARVAFVIPSRTTFPTSGNEYGITWPTIANPSIVPVTEVRPPAPSASRAASGTAT